MSFSFANEFNSTPKRAYMNAAQLLQYNGGYTDVKSDGAPATEPVGIKSLSVSQTEVVPLQGCVQLAINYDGSLGTEYDKETYKLSEHVGDPIYLNLPGHMGETCVKISQNVAAIRAITDGKVGIRLYEYVNKLGKQVGVEWVDIE